MSGYQAVQAEEDEPAGLTEEAQRDLELNPRAAQEFELDYAARYERELNELTGDESIMEATAPRNALGAEDINEAMFDETAAFEIAHDEQVAYEPPSHEEN